MRRPEGDEAAAPAPQPEPAWEEVSLADIVRTVWSRRILLATFILLGLLGSVAAVVLTQPEFQASSTVIPLEEPDIIQNWLESRKAAEVVVQAMGPRLYPVLQPQRWDAATEQWVGTPPTVQELGDQLVGHVRVAAARTSQERLITITVTMPTAVAARDVAVAYVDTLQTLRPELVKITKDKLFDKYYDGQNAQEAERRAETAAEQKDYWIALDTPLVPSGPSKPQPTLYVTLGVVLGGMLGILAVFGAEWLSKFRAELPGKQELTMAAAPVAPASPVEPDAGASTQASEVMPAVQQVPATSRFAQAPRAAPGNGGKGFSLVRRGTPPEAPSGPEPEPVTRFWKPQR